ncbi:hypothetical protein [Enterobacter phage EC151]|nr:hypothetical protein [Enterobacter phage EC151]
MYDLTKEYKTKAMAVNAIRMTATNKGWKVLSTDEAATHVWPSAAGFTVNNTTLNLALGFITEEQAEVAQRVPAGSVTDGKALEAVNAALAEQANVDKKAPKLQAPSKLEQDKKAAKASKKAAKESAEPKAPTRCETKNGARRPLRGKTLLVWETAERMAATGTIPTMKQVHEELLKTEPGFNKTTTGIQYYACKAYNGWESTKGSK